MSGILGGGGSSSSSKSGYSALSPALRAAFDPIGQAVGQYTNPNNPGVQEMFTPMGQTADETAGLNAIRQGFTPTADSLRSDLSMLMNPYDQFVIDEINNQAQGDFSILKQNMNQAGQFGSNRQQLGANDIDMRRLGQIGQFRQGQYNQSIDQIFNNLIPQRQQDAQGMLGIGSFERGLDTQTRQAPISALQSGTSMIAPFISGGTSNQSTTPDYLGNAGTLLYGLGTFFSDRRLKENIIHIGEENGHKIYQFNYINGDTKHIGVMADEVPAEAVSYEDGYAMVDYNMIGVRFRRAA